MPTAPGPWRLHAAHGALAAVFLAATTVARPASDESVAPAPASPVEELLAKPLVVDGEPIPKAVLQRHLIHSVGANVLARIRMRWMVEAELTERAHRHAVHAPGPREETFERTYANLMSGLEISADELADEVSFQRSFLHWRHADLDPDTAIRLDYGTFDEFREHVRAVMLFDRVFLPDDPEEWPRITVEAFLADPGGGQILIEDARESYLTRLRLGEEYGDDPPRDDEGLRRAYREIVSRSLTSWLDIRTAVDDLEPPLIATVDFDADGRPEETLSVDDVWGAVAPLLDVEDVRLARAWAATVSASRSRLLESGHGPEADLRQLARQTLRARDDGRDTASWEGKFPSVEVFYEFLCLREGVRRRHARDLARIGTVLLPAREPVGSGRTPGQDARSAPAQPRNARDTLPRTAELVPESLTDAVWRVRSAAGRARVQAEFLLIAAWDEETATWNDDGWACARERADELAERLKHQAGIHRLQVARFRQVTVPAPSVLWAAAVDEHSEFWEPPASRTPRTAPPLRKGRFGSREFDELRSMLRVTDYRRFAQRGSLADDVMFHLPVERIIGPRRGPLGYYLVRVVRRDGPARQIDAVDWLDEVLDEATLDYAREAVEAAEISGLD